MNDVELWHFTCMDRAAKLGPIGSVMPIMLQADGGPEAAANLPTFLRWIASVAWFTDQPDGSGTALQGKVCEHGDRQAFRYRVLDTSACRPWHDWAFDVDLPRRFRLELDLAYGAKPKSWWVSLEPVPVAYAPEFP